MALLKNNSTNAPLIHRFDMTSVLWHRSLALL